MNHALPYTDIETLTNHYNCKKCNAMFSLLNKQATVCPMCIEEHLSLLSADEWYKELKTRLDDDEWEDTKKERKGKQDSIVDITYFKDFDS